MSFILNLEEVFEKYIRNVLVGDVSSLGTSIEVFDGNREGKGYLYWDSTSNEVRPDIVIRKDRRITLIADVKYKPRTTESDRYQVIAHAHSLGAKNAVLVLPTPTNEDAGLLRRGQILNAAGLEVFEYHFSLDRDLPEQEEKFKENMARLLR